MNKLGNKLFKFGFPDAKLRRKNTLACIQELLPDNFCTLIEYALEFHFQFDKIDKLPCIFCFP